MMIFIIKLTLKRSLQGYNVSDQLILSLINY